MKAYQVIYQHGHFIDKDTKQRIIPVQGAEYIITATDGSFKNEDDKLSKTQPLSSVEKFGWAKRKFGMNNFFRILPASTKLFFRVGNAKTIQGDESIEYVFTCSLLEDLYLYKVFGRKGESEEDWRMSECQCMLDACVIGGLALTEKIQADSLNKLFSNTVMFYFPMQRSGACNAFKTFFTHVPDIKISVERVRSGNYECLMDLRKDHVEKLNPKKSQ